MALGVFALTDYQGFLVVGGSFHQFLGHERVNLQAWDGTEHHDLPGAFATLANRVRAMVVYEGDLIVAGTEPAFGHVARWDGTTWNALASGLSAPVFSLAVHNGMLHAAGESGNVWRWQSGVWEQLGSGLGAPVLALCVHGDVLYAGGEFTATSSGITGLHHIAQYDGDGWTPVGPGLNGVVHAMQSDAEGLLIGGDMTATADQSLALAHWTVFNGTGYLSKPSVKGGGPVTGFYRISDGRLLVGGSQHTLVMKEDEVVGSFRFSRMHAAQEYAGSTVLAGRGSMALAHTWTNGIGRMIEGTIVADLELNSIRAMVSPFPGAFTDHWSNEPGFEVPQGEDTHSIYTTIPWIIGLADGSPVGFTPATFQSQGTWPRYPWAGPNADAVDDGFYERYHRVWKLDRAMVQNHIALWQDPGYEMPEPIASWPGNGDVSNGEPALLAPFMDVNGDGIYDPWSGDYPIIRGDQAVYAIMHAEWVSQWGGMAHPEVDIHAMYHVYHPFNQPALDGVVFVNYRYVNRSSQTYEQVRFAQYIDADIGCFQDDLAGCDSTRNVIYAYNGFDFDADCSTQTGYGPTPPAQGAVFLNEPLRSHSVITTSFVPTGSALMDLMFGTINGQPFDLGGSTTNYMFPGGDHMDQFNPALIDRISIGATGPFTLAPQDTLCIDLAFVYARAGSGGALASRDALLTRVDSVRAFYMSHALACAEEPIMVGIAHPHDIMPDVRLFPNPATHAFQVVAGKPIQRVAVLDMQGRLVRAVHTFGERVFVPSGDMARGTYVVQVFFTNGSRALRVVLE